MLSSRGAYGCNKGWEYIRNASHSIWLTFTKNQWKKSPILLMHEFMELSNGWIVLGLENSLVFLNNSILYVILYFYSFSMFLSTYFNNEKLIYMLMLVLIFGVIWESHIHHENMKRLIQGKSNIGIIHGIRKCYSNFFRLMPYTKQV